jgi:hypothetical protein
MGIVRMGPPNDLILMLKECSEVNSFIETGTHLGNTAYWSSQKFGQVITLEYSTEMYQQATQKYGNVENIKFLQGDSRVLLQEIVSSLKQPSMFWLDAHWSGGQTYGEEDECPLLEELEIINASPYDHIILIDDARLFLSPPPAPHRIEHWSDISAVIDCLNLVKNRYTVIIEDVIISVPNKFKPVLAQYCQDLNTKLWKEYAKQQNTKIQQGLKLILQGMKQTTLKLLPGTKEILNTMKRNG